MVAPVNFQKWDDPRSLLCSSKDASLPFCVWKYALLDGCVWKNAPNFDSSENFLQMNGRMFDKISKNRKLSAAYWATVRAVVQETSLHRGRHGRDVEVGGSATVEVEAVGMWWCSVVGCCLGGGGGVIFNIEVSGSQICSFF